MLIVMLPLRRFVASLLVVAALLSQATPAAATIFSLAGSGWGHGVGLSQYGAKAMGADGNAYESIVDHYFNGVIIAPVATASPLTFVSLDPTPFLVGLIQDSRTVSFTIESDAARLCSDGTGSCFALVQPGGTYRFGPDGAGGCVFLRIPADGRPVAVGHAGSCAASVRPVSDRTVISIPFKARSYRYGTLRFRQDPGSGGIHTVYEIGIDDYMKGLSEVPESWSTAALEAQVVVSRSYAVWHALDRGDEGGLSDDRKDECFCNLRDDTSDQVFRGWTGEATHPRWVAAVASTASQVMTANGTIALGLYSSSSGGATEDYVDVFGGTGHPYLVTATDGQAFSDSAANPHATWTAGYDQAALAATFGFSWVSNAVVGERNGSGSARSIRLSGIVGGRPAETTISGLEMRSAFSLRSTTFDIVVTPQFDDVSAGHRFAGEVLGLSELGITSGCTALSFCPERSVTRAEMAAFLVRALALPPAGGLAPFADVDGHALEAEIAALHASGITSGCTALSFCPERPVTRAEMAAFLIRSLA
jgi:stage II sporulation protein D